MVTSGGSGSGSRSGGTNHHHHHRDALEWKFSQVFGERVPGEQIRDDDIISAIEFEKKGDYLAAGDHGGRVVLFERIDEKVHYSREEAEHLDHAVAVHPKYVYKTEFQSHDPEFDYLKSLEIEEKVNKLRWCTTVNNALFILSTNNKTIKLWKVQDQKVKQTQEMSLTSNVSSENFLLSENSFTTGENEQFVPNGYRLEWINKKPKITAECQEGNFLISNIEEASSRCRRVYAHAHEFNINSISVNSDGETFLSADELRINLWNLEISNQCFNITDMKPPNMEDLIEVITVAEFHPSYCNILAFGSSRGFIRLVDMRKSALCDKNARIFHNHEAHASRSIFTEIISSISDVKFAGDGMHMLSRDYMHLKLWDLRMESSPVTTFKIHEHLRPKLPDLYNNDSIFDKFECCLSADGHHFATGSYSNIFRVFSNDSGHEDETTLEATKNPNSRTHVSHTSHKTTRFLTSFARGHHKRGHDNLNSNGSSGVACDLISKVTHLAWHPTSNFIACAATNSLYMYYA